jgi:hypothetical protein
LTGGRSEWVDWRKIGSGLKIRGRSEGAFMFLPIIFSNTGYYPGYFAGTEFIFEPFQEGG